MGKWANPESDGQQLKPDSAGLTVRRGAKHLSSLDFFTCEEDTNRA